MARDKNNKEMMQIRSFCETSTTSEGAIQSFSHGEIDFIDKRADLSYNIWNKCAAVNK